VVDVAGTGVRGYIKGEEGTCARTWRGLMRSSQRRRRRPSWGRGRRRCVRYGWVGQRGRRRGDVPMGMREVVVVGGVR